MKKTIVTRSKPENLLAEDIKIFEHEFTKVIPNPKIGKYNKKFTSIIKTHYIMFILKKQLIICSKI